MNWALGFFKNYPYIPFFILNLFLCLFLIWNDHKNEYGKRKIYLFFIPYITASFIIAVGLSRFMTTKDASKIALASASSISEKKFLVENISSADSPSSAFHADYQPETEVFTPPLKKETEESLEGKRLFLLAEKLRLVDKTEEAFALFTQARILFRNADETIPEAYTALRLANLQILMNFTAEAKELLLACLLNFKNAEDKFGLAFVYRELGKVNYHTGQYDRAKADYLQAISFLKTLKIPKEKLRS